MLMSTSARYHLGLPAWAFPGWRDDCFPAKPSQLVNYAKVFNTVEGNTTFYGIPDSGTVDRWRADVAGTDFKFCFKLPQTVTHERNPNWQDLRWASEKLTGHSNYQHNLANYFATRHPHTYEYFQHVAHRRLIDARVGETPEALKQQAWVLAQSRSVARLPRVKFQALLIFAKDNFSNASLDTKQRRSLRLASTSLFNDNPALRSQKLSRVGLAGDLRLYLARQDPPVYHYFTQPDLQPLLRRYWDDPASLPFMQTLFSDPRLSNYRTAPDLLTMDSSPLSATELQSFSAWLKDGMPPDTASEPGPLSDILAVAARHMDFEDATAMQRHFTHYRDGHYLPQYPEIPVDQHADARVLLSIEKIRQLGKKKFLTIFDSALTGFREVASDHRADFALGALTLAGTRDVAGV